MQPARQFRVVPALVAVEGTQAGVGTEIATVEQAAEVVETGLTLTSANLFTT